MNTWLNFFGVNDSRDIGQTDAWATLIKEAGLTYMQDGHEMVTGHKYMINGTWLMIFEPSLSGVLYFGLVKGKPMCLKSCMVHTALPF